jgi:hypothetical protein
MRALPLIAVLALVFACGREQSESRPVPIPVEPAPVDPDGRLDPAPYRAEIEATEVLLYAPEGLSKDGWKALSTALLELHNEIVFRDESISGREASARLFFLSARAEATVPKAPSDVDLAELRELWRQLSAEKFVTADWIRAKPSQP